MPILSAVKCVVRSTGVGCEAALHNGTVASNGTPIPIAAPPHHDHEEWDRSRDDKGYLWQNNDASADTVVTVELSPCEKAIEQEANYDVSTRSKSSSPIRMDFSSAADDASLRIVVTPATPGVSFPTACICSVSSVLDIRKVAAGGSSPAPSDVRDVIVREWVMMENRSVPNTYVTQISVRTIRNISSLLGGGSSNRVFLTLRFVGCCDATNKHKIRSLHLRYTLSEASLQAVEEAKERSMSRDDATPTSNTTTYPRHHQQHHGSPPTLSTRDIYINNTAQKVRVETSPNPVAPISRDSSQSPTDVTQTRSPSAASTGAPPRHPYKFESQPPPASYTIRSPVASLRQPSTSSHHDLSSFHYSMTERSPLHSTNVSSVQVFQEADGSYFVKSPQHPGLAQAPSQHHQHLNESRDDATSQASEQSFVQAKKPPTQQHVSNPVVVEIFSSPIKESTVNKKYNIIDPTTSLTTTSLIGGGSTPPPKKKPTPTHYQMPEPNDHQHTTATAIVGQDWRRSTDREYPLSQLPQGDEKVQAADVNGNGTASPVSPQPRPPSVAATPIVESPSQITDVPMPVVTPHPVAGPPVSGATDLRARDVSPDTEWMYAERSLSAVPMTPEFIRRGEHVIATPAAATHSHTPTTTTTPAVATKESLSREASPQYNNKAVVHSRVSPSPTSEEASFTHFNRPPPLPPSTNPSPESQHHVDTHLFSPPPMAPPQPYPTTTNTTDSISPPSRPPPRPPTTEDTTTVTAADMKGTHHQESLRRTAGEHTYQPHPAPPKHHIQQPTSFINVNKFDFADLDVVLSTRRAPSNKGSVTGNTPMRHEVPSIRNFTPVKSASYQQPQKANMFLNDSVVRPVSSANNSMHHHSNTNTSKMHPSVREAAEKGREMDRLLANLQGAERRRKADTSCGLLDEVQNVLGPISVNKTSSRRRGASANASHNTSVASVRQNHQSRPATTSTAFEPSFHVVSTIGNPTPAPSVSVDRPSETIRPVESINSGVTSSAATAVDMYTGWRRSVSQSTSASDVIRFAKSTKTVSEDPSQNDITHDTGSKLPYDELSPMSNQTVFDMPTREPSTRSRAPSVQLDPSGKEVSVWCYKHHSTSTGVGLRALDLKRFPVSEDHHGPPPAVVCMRKEDGSLWKGVGGNPFVPMGHGGTCVLTGSLAFNDPSIHQGDVEDRRLCMVIRSTVDGGHPKTESSSISEMYPVTIAAVEIVDLKQWNEVVDTLRPFLMAAIPSDQ